MIFFTRLIPISSYCLVEPQTDWINWTKFVQLQQSTLQKKLQILLRKPYPSCLPEPTQAKVYLKMIVDFLMFSYVYFVLDVKYCALLLGLNTILPPIPAGSRFKPTICVAQEDTIIFAECLEDAYNKVQNTYQNYADRNLPEVPKLVVLGNDLNDIRGRFLVHFKDFNYELTSAARAIDVIIKTTAVLGLPFSKVSKLLWHFLSSEVYGIPERESYASINKLRNYLRSKEQKHHYDWLYDHIMYIIISSRR